MHRPLARSLVLVALVAACTADNSLGPTERPAIALVDAVLPQVQITEVLPDPTKVLDAQGEWFELFNAGADAVDLSGWRIVSGPTGAEQHVIATSIVLPSGGYVVLGNNIDSTTNGGARVRYSYGTSITLNNSNTDWLALKLADGTVVDSVSYSARSGGAIVAPTYTPTAGASRVMLDAAVDNTLLGGPNWANTPTSVTFGLGDRGTPGSGPYSTVVPPGPVVSVTVTPDPATVTTGGTRAFGAVGRDSAGRPSPTSFTWASTDPDVATIDAGTGVATGLVEGVTTIIATSTEGIADSATLTVAPPAVGSITIAINTPRQAPVTYVKPAFPTVRDGSGVVISPTPKLTWSSSDTAIAEVDSLGYISAKAVGAVVIRATAQNGVSGTTTFTVIPETAPTSAVYGDHLAFGTPTDATPGDELPITKPQLVESYSVARGAPNWVSWTLDGSQFGAAPRCDCFSPDPDLPDSAYHVVDLDYRNSGYDRGHMVQSESRTTTDQENASTFRLTNIVPQAGENNQGPWGQFENFLNDLARTGGKDIWVIAGGQYAAAPGTLKGEGKIQIPDYTWKVAVILPEGALPSAVNDAGDLQILAVRMPNLVGTTGPASATGIRNIPWQTYLVTVDQIEAAVGYDLLAALPDPLEQILEANDRAPVAALTVTGGGPEGTAFHFDAGASSDPDGDVLTWTWVFGDGTGTIGASVSHAYGDDGTYGVMVIVSDPTGAADTAMTTVHSDNVAPTLAATFTVGPVPLYTPATIQVTWTDPGLLDTHTALVTWGDGTTETVTLSGGSATIAHLYPAVGFYTPSIALSDDDGGTDAASAATPTVVVDPRTASVAANGWVELDPTARGKVKGTFTIAVEYPPGGAAPTGLFTWIVKERNISFEATRFDWLVSDGGNASLRGRGTLAGTGAVTFELAARDGSRGSGVGGVRLRLWSGTGALLFDSSSAAGSDPFAVGPLGGGNVEVR